MSNPAFTQFNAANIPTILKNQKRWSVWRPQWIEKRQKFDKIPHNAYRPEYGISTKKLDKWADYDAALSAQADHPERFPGLGFCVTDIKNIVAFDLDHCFDDDGLAPWADEIVKRVNTYTELSPSGNGLRMFALGTLPEDWNNHDIGIELYGGSSERFLTVTGAHLPGTPSRLTVLPRGLLASLEVQYRKAKTVTADSNPMPDIGELDELPEYRDRLTRKAKDFLDTGENHGDRSRALFATAVALSAAGLTPAECFTVLASNEYAMECAMDHRRDDYDKALEYIWTTQCEKGKAVADETKAPSSRDFEDLYGGDDMPPVRELKTRYDCDDLLYSTTEDDAPGSEDPMDDFEAFDDDEEIPDKRKPIKDNKYAFTQAGEFAANALDVSYLIDDVIPKAPLVTIFGMSTTGKSFVAIDLGMAIAQGLPWRGHDVEQGTVAYICAEGAGGFKRRLQAYGNYNDIDLAGIPFHVLGDAPNLSEVEDTRELIIALKTIKPKITIVDTLAQSFQGNENSGEDIGRLLAHCKAIHKCTGSTVVLIHHSGKDTTKGARGHSSLRAACDAELEIIREGDARSITVTKMKDGDDGKEYPFKLITVDLGVNSKGKSITSCVIEHTDESPKAVQNANKANQSTGEKGKYELAIIEIVGTFQTFNPDETVHPDEVINAIMQRIPPGDGKDRRRECALRAIESLAKKGKIDKSDGLILINEGEGK